MKISDETYRIGPTKQPGVLRYMEGVPELQRKDFSDTYYAALC